jgi:hypothetical protein
VHNRERGFSILNKFYLFSAETSCTKETVKTLLTQFTTMFGITLTPSLMHFLKAKCLTGLELLLWTLALAQWLHLSSSCSIHSEIFLILTVQVRQAKTINCDVAVKSVVFLPKVKQLLTCLIYNTEQRQFWLVCLTKGYHYMIAVKPWFYVVVEIT